MTEDKNKSPDQLRQELGLILARVTELRLNSRINAVKLARAYFRLKKPVSLNKECWRRRGRFAIGILLACVLGFAARSYYRSLRFDRVSIIDIFSFFFLLSFNLAEIYKKKLYI